VIGLALTTALLLALAAAGLRVLRRRRVCAAAATLPGARPDTAIRVRDFAEIDAALRARRCICGGFLTSLGERSARDGDRVLRVVRAECGRCEDEQTVYFDTSTLLH
jgi:hypothetical protein